MGASILAILALLDDINRRQVESVITHTNQVIESLMRKDLGNRITAIDRLARRWTESSGTPRTIWERDAIELLSDLPGFKAVAWIDAKQNFQWVAPSEGNAAMSSQALGKREPLKKVLGLIEGNYASGISQSFQGLEGDLNMIVFAPATRNTESDGLIVGLLSLRPWIVDLLSGAQSGDFQLQVFMENQKIYEYTSVDFPLNQVMGIRHDFDLHGTKWTTYLSSTENPDTTIYSRVFKRWLMIGLLPSVLFALTVYLSLAAMLRTRELKVATRQLSLLMQNFQGMVYRTLDTNYPWPMHFASEGCRTLSGHERSDLEEQRVLWGESINPEDREHVIAAIQDAIKNDKHFDVVYRIRTTNGCEKWVWDQGSCVVDPLTKAQVFEGFISDISERKTAELELIREQALTRSIVDTAVEAIITIDTTGKIDSFNQAAEKMFNYSSAEVVGENVSMLMPLPYRNEHNQYLLNYIETGAAQIIGIGRDVSAQRKDGSEFPIQLSVSEIEGQGRRMFVGLIRDISAEKKSEREASVRQEQLARVDRLHLLGEMATGIAHEINQPLTSISLFSQAGKRFLELGNYERLPDIFDKLSQHALRAGSIVEQMQAMTRQRESERTTVECRQLINEITQLAEADARIHDLQVKVTSNGALPMVAVDVIQIQQVALNLLRNGMEAMQEVDCHAGSTIELNTRLLDSGDILFSVIDSGGGVSEDIVSKLFTPFATTKKYGMGMGLSICRAIIIAHGGQLNYINNESGGTTFYFNIPSANGSAQSE